MPAARDQPDEGTTSGGASPEASDEARRQSGFRRPDSLKSWSVKSLIERIVSGGQTGADRAALDCAINWGIPHSGWCPKGRRAEDSPIDPRYQLKETPSSDYIQRSTRPIPGFTNREHATV
jgi:hypothetical protein